MSKAVSTTTGGKSITMIVLPEVAEFINQRNERYQQVEKEATVLMLEMGLAIAKAKADLKHGQLQHWIAKFTTLSYPHASRFHKLAQVFIETQKIKEGEAFALVDPANSKKSIAEKLQQMAFNFLGDKTQAELFAEYGIAVKQSKPLGGHHPRALPDLPAGETLDHYDAVLAVGGLLKELDRCCLSEKRRIVDLKPNELKRLEGDLMDSLQNVRTLIKAG